MATEANPVFMFGCGHAFASRTLKNFDSCPYCAEIFQGKRNLARMRANEGIKPNGFQALQQGYRDKHFTDMQAFYKVKGIPKQRYIRRLSSQPSQDASCSKSQEGIVGQAQAEEA